jgi:hypothetical protein
MKRWNRLAAGLVLGAMAAAAQGDALDLKSVPADAKWVVHLDMDLTRQSRAWAMALDRADRDSNGEARRKLAAVSTLLGSRFPEDVHGVTIVGRGVKAGPNKVAMNGVMIVRAKLDRERLSALVKLNEEYTSSAYDGKEISGWRVEKEGPQRMYGSFAGDSIMVVGSSEDEVKAELDVLAGKGKALAGEGPLAAAVGKGTGAMLYIAGDGLSDLRETAGASPIVAQLNSAWVSVSETPTDLVVRASVEAKTPEVANQLRSMGDGFKALAMLARGGDAGEKKFIGDALGKATLAVSGTTVTLDWPVSLEVLKSAVDHAKPRQRGATEPAGEKAGEN